MSAFLDPEMSYRRGYEHGAWELFHAIEDHLPPSIREEAKTWIQRDIRTWRVANLTGNAVRSAGATAATFDIAPPSLRLRKNSGQGAIGGR